MNLRKFTDKILVPLKRWSPLGELTDNYGTTYIGHIFKSSALGYLHVLYKGTCHEKILMAEQKIGRTFPNQYKEFLLLSNGANFYSPSGINIYGILQDEYYPDIKTKPWRFPTNIVEINQCDWLSDFPDSAVVVGKDEGVGNYIVSLYNDGPIFEFDVNEPSNIEAQWDSFDDWIFSVLDDLFIEHDDYGALLNLSADVN